MKTDLRQILLPSNFLKLHPVEALLIGNIILEKTGKNIAIFNSVESFSDFINNYTDVEEHVKDYFNYISGVKNPMLKDNPCIFDFDNFRFEVKNDKTPIPDYVYSVLNNVNVLNSEVLTDDILAQVFEEFEDEMTQD